MVLAKNSACCQTDKQVSKPSLSVVLKNNEIKIIVFLSTRGSGVLTLSENIFLQELYILFRKVKVGCRKMAELLNFN